MTYIEQLLKEQREMCEAAYHRFFTLQTMGASVNYTILNAPSPTIDPSKLPIDSKGMKMISVKERKPDITKEEDDCQHLIYGCKFGNLEKDVAGYYATAWYNGKFWEDDRNKDIEDNPDFWAITHWQPLPHPPTDKQQP
jgi:hypothetical protein